MKEYQILVKDHGLEFLNSTGTYFGNSYVHGKPLWLADYSMSPDGEFMTKFVLNRADSNYFDEDDYIIEVFKNKFKEVVFIEVPDETIKLFPNGVDNVCQGSDGGD